jgi:hypothetical protein
MIVCSNCKKEMKCTYNGIACRWNQGSHVYAGDEFTCMECGLKIVRCNDRPHYEINPLIKPKDLIMDDYTPEAKKTKINLRRTNDIRPAKIRGTINEYGQESGISELYPAEDTIVFTRGIEGNYIFQFGNGKVVEFSRGQDIPPNIREWFDSDLIHRSKTW